MMIASPLIEKIPGSLGQEIIVPKEASYLPVDTAEGSVVKKKSLRIQFYPLKQIFQNLTQESLSVNPSLIWWEGVFSYQPQTLKEKIILFSKWVVELSVKKRTA